MKQIWDVTSASTEGAVSLDTLKSKLKAEEERGTAMTS